jgi:uncharacterized membrane protein
MNPAQDRRARLALLVVAALALAFASGIAVVPWLEMRGAPAGPLLRLAYAPLCHQLPERSFEIGSHSMAVCARCTGLYAGGVAGLLLALGGALARVRPRPWWLAAAVAPTAIDFGFGWVGLPALANLPRALLAVPAGLVAGLFLSVAILDLFESRNGAERPARGGILSVREG